MKQFDVIIVGGGAAGFFAAINIAEINPKLKIIILERGSKVLSKVKVSGGGRCNVTHAEFDPRELTTNYPRGQKELMGPFHKFMTGDTVQWFADKGVELKTEEDGRMFPKSDSSQTIINCFISETEKHNISILKNNSLKRLSKKEKNWLVETNSESFLCQKLLLATGSDTKIWNILKELGHSIVDPVPSLFTFNIKDERIKDIPGVVVKNVKIRVLESQLESEGPLLVTHWGMSAPAILKLSAFGALELHEKDYKFKIAVNFVNDSYESVITKLKGLKQIQPKKLIFNSPQFNIPKRLWQKLLVAAKISKELFWTELNKDQVNQFALQLTKAVFIVEGKSTFKDEFVTAGGIDLKEVNFKTFESKIHRNLFFAGEILNIDAITGGFNFQNAWTGGYIAAEAIAKN